MLHRKHVTSVEIPTAYLLGNSEIAQDVSNTRSYRFPKEIWTIGSQNLNTVVTQSIAHSRLAKFVKLGRQLSQVVRLYRPLYSVETSWRKL
jgi:hypothetical protein